MLRVYAEETAKLTWKLVLLNFATIDSYSDKRAVLITLKFVEHYHTKLGNTVANTFQTDHLVSLSPPIYHNKSKPSQFMPYEFIYACYHFAGIE